MERRRMLQWAMVGAAAVLAIAVCLPLVAVLQPGYYRRYPALGQRMDHWAVSTHSRISCASCHIDPGVTGWVTFAMRAVPAFYAQIIQGPDATNLLRPPDKASCMQAQCHTAFRTVSPSGDLKIPHKAHVEVLGMQCVTCHKDLVHSLNRRGFNRPEMKTCMTCHNGDRASDKCSDCHTQLQTPASHKAADWLEVHGKQPAKSCAQCHDWTPDFCAACHEKRPASHAGNWKQGHAAPATARGNGCLVCHSDQFCKKCH